MSYQYLIGPYVIMICKYSKCFAIFTSTANYLLVWFLVGINGGNGKPRTIPQSQFFEILKSTKRMCIVRLVLRLCLNGYMCIDQCLVIIFCSCKDRAGQPECRVQVEIIALSIHLLENTENTITTVTQKIQNGQCMSLTIFNQIFGVYFKVNGTLVTNSNHKEVVTLIKAGSYVALTLLGKPPSSRNSGSGKFDHSLSRGRWL